MKQLLSMLILVVTMSSLTGCIVRTGPRHHHGRSRACPPSYHWNGAACVHNSNRGRGRGGPPVRDHRR